MTDRDRSITLDHVVLKRGDQTFRFNCHIGAGRVTAVCGPSGSGKTTLLNLIAGFEQPQQGRIRFGAEDSTALLPGSRPVSLVFQDNNLFAHLDLFTNIGLGISPALRLSAEDRARILASLERTGLGGYQDRLPGTLSGGERQRAAFARALVRDRPFLLLDEPFAALDPGLRASMADLLAALQRETGVTVLLVTHMLSDVERLADRVIFLKDGEICADEARLTFLSRETPEDIAEFLGKAARKGFLATFPPKTD